MDLKDQKCRECKKGILGQWGGSQGDRDFFADVVRCSDCDKIYSRHSNYEAPSESQIKSIYPETDTD